MKLNTQNIPGFTELPQDAQEYLSGLEVAENSAYNQLATKNKELTQQLRAKQTEEEQKESARSAEFQALQDQNKQLTDEINLLKVSQAQAGYTAKLIGQGYDEKTAAEAAKYLASGDTAKYLDVQQKFLADRDEKAKAQQLNQTPAPGSGAGTTSTPDLQKEIDARMAAGDTVGAVALIRQQQQSGASTT